MSLFVACDSERQTLNSERIEQQFGSYGVDILYADDARRISNLYSDEPASGKICRTFAIVEFSLPVDRRIVSQHERIVAGESIGQVFADAGWQIDKQNLFIGESDVADYSYNLREMMHIDSQRSLATHRYRFIISQGDLRIEYATITEVHHPEYLDSGRLRSNYD